MVDTAPGDVTQLLNRLEAGHTQAAEDLLPIVYAELRRLARARLAKERSPTVPEPTSLVHEAYLRLVGDHEVRWEGRAHFFGAAAEAMRRILIDRARRRASRKRGGRRQRVTLDDEVTPAGPPDVELLALDAALDRLEARDPGLAQIVKLRYFAGLTVPETAEALNLSSRTVNRRWMAARALLHRDVAAASPEA